MKTTPTNNNNNNDREQIKKEVYRRSLPSHLLWRSVLGSPAAWSGSSCRGVYIMDPNANVIGSKSSSKSGSRSMIQYLPTDKRMFHLPKSLRDAIIEDGMFSSNQQLQHDSKQSKQTQQQDCGNNNNNNNNTPCSNYNMQLLSYPRIKGAASPQQSSLYSSSSSSSSRAYSRTSNGISCMDIDRGNDTTLTGSPPRYLLVGSGGGDCSIAKYDLSYYGSEHYLNQHQHSSSLANGKSASSSSQINSQFINNHHHQQQQSHHDLSTVTHKPIARSKRHDNSDYSAEENACGLPSGHRQPLLGINWYPGDVNGMFVSASISGEILVWDAQTFVPVFATYTHVYTGMSGRRGTGGGIARSTYEEDGNNKSVAPLQCMDLPKTPEGCPHGNALLALGLGVDGRGVIQLCDAFRGGSATHELVGHGTNGGGGVNAVAWDPNHPFRLASGGDDCTVRLWDIRKAGAAACLGVLNKENDENEEWTTMHSPKRQKIGLHNNMKSMSSMMMNGIESHGGPVTALAFAPGGDDLVSSGLDGRIHHWDLRPDSSFVSSFSAIGKRGRALEKGGGGMDPAVATRGRLLPTCFTGHVSALKPSSKRRVSRQNKPSLAIIQPGSRSTSMLIATNTGNASKGQILGYSLYGRRGKEPGGNPDFALSGHLSDVTCLLPIVGIWDNLKAGIRDNTVLNDVKFFTGGRDGIVLSWGRSRQYRNEVGTEDNQPLLGMDNEQCQSFRSCGRRNAHVVFDEGRFNHQTQEPPSLEDIDHW